MTEEQYEKKEKAKETNLIAFLQSEYPDMIEYNTSKQEWRVPNTNIKISETAYYDFDTGTGGDNIRFMTDIMQKSFFQAIDELAASDVDAVDLNDIKKKEYKKPVDANDDAKVIQYLLKRKIDKSIIEKYIYEGLIYCDEQFNVVFYNYCQEFCILMSTYNDDWKGIRSESVYGYWEVTNGNCKDVYIFESPVDALSYMTIYNRPGVYIAMGGLKKGTMEHIKQDYEGYRLYMCVDWDDAGNQFSKNYEEVDRITGTIGKDWNDELCENREEKRVIPKYDLFD